ncbi:hypothetical protein EON83_04100 [bacterium]|nr:MAG: hypothetical protein EON83_04100 [bacterium]
MKTASSYPMCLDALRRVKVWPFGIFVAGLGLIAGCNSQPAETPIAENPPPVAPVAATTPEATQAPRMAYQAVTEFNGKSNVVFTLDINGATVGSYSTDKAQNDITNSLHDGLNDIKVSWTADPTMPSYGAARIKLQSQSNGKWNDVMTREVRRDTPAGATTINLQIGMPPAQSSPTEAVPSTGTSANTAAEPAANTVTAGETSIVPDATPTTAAFADKYLLKTTYSSLAPGSFDVTINGQTVGSYNSASNRDISSYLKPGVNEITVSWQAAQTITNRFADSKLTIGVFREGKWSTVANQTITQAQPRGERTWKINVQ